MKGLLPRGEFGSVGKETNKSSHKKASRAFSHLEPPRVSTYECKHRSIYGQQRVFPIQQFRLSNGCEPIPDVVFGIANHLFKLLAVFRRLRGTRMSGLLFLYTKVTQSGPGEEEGTSTHQLQEHPFVSSVLVRRARGRRYV